VAESYANVTLGVTGDEVLFVVPVHVEAGSYIIGALSKAGNAPRWSASAKTAGL
jgi:hypothetical protein